MALVSIGYILKLPVADSHRIYADTRGIDGYYLRAETKRARNLLRCGSGSSHRRLPAGANPLVFPDRVAIEQDFVGGVRKGGGLGTQACCILPDANAAVRGGTES